LSDPNQTQSKNPIKNKWQYMVPNHLTKEQFLANLERALQKLILERLFDNEDAATKENLKADIEEFVQLNVSQYSLEELNETFTSADAAIGLFLEYQDAKRMTARTDKMAAAPKAKAPSGPMIGPCFSSDVKPVFPSDIWKEPQTGIELVWVHGASYQMGSGPWDTEGLADEKPVHEVLLDGFWMGRFPITVAQYAMFVSDVKSNEPVWLETGSKYNIYSGEDPLYKDLGSAITSDDAPITGISWHDATAYARWLSQLTGQYFRLPTEAEWEFAARSGGCEEKYAGASEPAGVAWYADNSNGRPNPVGKKESNGLGIFDMCGNVCEWCQDLYDKDAYRHHRLYNPLNTEKGSCRVVRGGSWDYGARDVRCADRSLFVPEHRDCNLGFRIARSA